MTKRNIIVRTNNKLSLNNPDRLKRFNKDDMKYIDGIIDYYSDDKKRIMNITDYFTGKINKHEDINLVLEDGRYATKEETEKRQKYINKQFKNSNVWQLVLSVPKEVVDDNITWRELEIKLAKEILPKTFKKIGFEDPKKMCYQFSLHMNTGNPHFHIAFLEKQPNTRNHNGKKLQYRRNGKIPQSAIRFLKSETTIAIERNGRFKPMAIEINKDIEEFKKYFSPNSRNFVLYDKENILIEEKILNLGKLLNEREISYNNRIKFNSIKDQKIKTLTKEIKDDLFKINKDLIMNKSEFNNSIRNLNDYIIDVGKRNGINKKYADFTYTESKEKYLDNYILNAIVNHARYYYKNESKKVVDSNDIIQSIILNNYKKKKGYSKKDIIRSYLSNSGTSRYQNKRDIRNAIKKLNNEMDEATKEFYKLFESDLLDR